MHPWNEEGLHLFTPEEVEQLPDGTVLESIMQDDNPVIKGIKGKDYIDTDTRFGHIAYGGTDP